MENKVQFKRLVIAAYRLPFKFVRTKNGYSSVQNSGGLVSAVLSLSEKHRVNNNNLKQDKIIWAGVSSGIPSNISKSKLEDKDFKICPVPIPAKIHQSYYSGFCNNLIWPLFHYFPSLVVYNDSYYDAYEKVNREFCNKLLKIIKPGDFIWVHDYQLMLLPGMLRKKLPNATIGFFLHIPFPSSELFRLMPRVWRDPVINGILGADLVGFHTNDYTQHFIKSVKRTTGHECQQNFIFTSGRIVKADAFPIGIDYDKFNFACTEKPTLVEKRKLRSFIQNKKLIFSVDRLDYSKGLLFRLRGFEKFLEMYPKWHSRVIFNMVVVPSRDSIESYKDMKQELEYMVGRINGKYSTLDWRPIAYQYKSLSFNELIALYDMSDVGLITPLRDGMNLVAKEYVASQVENQGVLILSEMTGAAAELKEALLINPADKTEMAEAIYTALTMKKTEKIERLKRMKSRISNYNIFTWAFDFFNKTFKIKQYQQMMSAKYVSNEVFNDIISKYNEAKKRILFLDYDGTLVAFAKYPELAVIDYKTKEILRKLSDDPKNEVVVISGRDKGFLEKQFSDLNVTLVAEHGYFIKKKGKEWEVTVNNANMEWKEEIKLIVADYVNMCNGTFIEEKAGSIAWHYRNADLDYAQLRLNELLDDLTELVCRNTDLEILEGNKVLEIKNKRYDKGEAAMSFMKGKTFDFIFAAGDDKTDEYIFKVMPEQAITVKIGAELTLAKYNINNNSSLVGFLKTLAEE